MPPAAVKEMLGLPCGCAAGRAVQDFALRSGRGQAPSASPPSHP
ncbi:MAG: hypothetical protein PQJ59_05025 [Spirochaetales bacterium]|nr:hypothetical protein [Spirochaetales bacterium]